ncbi:MAG: response regulator [Proteobacteria bacterium]|nr:response regulator [Pseudomonadota bacterium]
MATVLLVEDDPNFCMFVSAILEHSGHDVRFAADGDLAIESFTQRRPDLVITDLVMLRRDGIDTIRTLRDFDPRVPIIAMSGANAAVLKLAQFFGAVATLAKPFNAAMLLNAVSMATESKGA